MICTPTSCAPKRPIDAEDRGEQRHRDHAAEEPRHDDAPHRVDRHHLHRRELVGRAHQAELRGERRSGTAREQQRRDHRPEFLEQPERRRRCRATPRSRSARSRSKPCRPSTMPTNRPRQHDDHERQRAGVVDLLDDQAEAQQRARRARARRGPRRARRRRASAATSRDAVDAARAITGAVIQRRLPSSCSA